MRRWTTLIALWICLLLPRAGSGGELERGLAITDPLALRELDHGLRRADGSNHPGFGLTAMLDPEAAGPLRNDALFALPSLAALRGAIDAEYVSYLARHQARTPLQSIGVGSAFEVQLFDRAALFSERSHFALAGIVNRMDRAYLAPDSCGEIRLIYRLIDDAGESPARLPMTLTIVLRARAEDAAASCADLARRWLAAGKLAAGGAEFAAALVAPGGPLADIARGQIDRIETNLQIAHVPKSATSAFRTDYLMKLFRFDRDTKTFVEAPLENQLDARRLVADAELGTAFKQWLLEPRQLAEFDRGTVLIPERFLAKVAIAATPAGFGRLDLQPAHALVEPRGAAPALFGDGDIIDALQRASQSGVALQNIRSVAGFARRLNDITCAGCHQTRGIGGFHFPGADAGPGAVAGSPLFFGDQVRRRDIVTAMADARPPDFSRGFSDRPQTRGTRTLLGTQYYDGWGATCYRPGAAGRDASFRDWTCAEGLSCEAVGEGAASPIGMCFVANR